MKSRLALAALVPLVLATVSLGQIASAASVVPGEQCADSPSGEALSVRIKPTAKSKSAFAVADGDCSIWIQIPVRTSGQYVAISYKGKSGWATSKFLVPAAQDEYVEEDEAPARSPATFPKEGENCSLISPPSDAYDNSGRRLYCVSGKLSRTFREPRVGDECVFAIKSKGLDCVAGVFRSEVVIPTAANAAVSSAGPSPIIGGQQVAPNTIASIGLTPNPAATYVLPPSERGRLADYSAALAALSDHMYKYYPSYAVALRSSCDNDRVATAEDAWLDSSLWRFVKKGYLIDDAKAGFIAACTRVLETSRIR